MNKTIMLLVLDDAIGTYQAFLKLRHATEAERQITQLKLAECEDLRSKLGATA